ncbi:MAG: glycosyltransferase family 2 protein [Lachnospiraceae bacterium]|nr:glycosyltransferase family 2 protein [Lachnospiraceae bacterium]MCM1239268.1 glycosyltransferase family 2 protein [Lachnospiraceae bacterium]
MNEVTVVIPNYNGAGLLRECLQALAEQDRDTPAYEILVVDNGSEDGSLELMEREFPQVRVIALPENTGFCHAVNVGIEASKSPYVILLNNDTKVRERFIYELYHAMESRPSAFSVSAKMLMWDRPELLDDAGDLYCVFGWAFARGKGKPAAVCDKEKEVFSACGGAAIYRRSILEEIGLFDELHFAYMEDLDLGYRARIYGYRNHYEPKAEVIHYGSASSGSRYNAFKTKLASANNIYVIGKNMPLLQWVWNLPFLVPGFLIKFLFFCKKGMGGLYLKGLKEGFEKLFSEEGRKRRIRFQWAHLGNYLAIQWQLYANMLRFLKKY